MSYRSKPASFLRLPTTLQERQVFLLLLVHLLAFNADSFVLLPSSTTTTTSRSSSLLAMSTTTTNKSGNHHGKKDIQHIVIAGAGMVGTSTAYYLATQYQIPKITLIDPSGQIAPAASGKAGGFLALDWNDHSPVGPLARRSFGLHATLAETLGADTIDYRRLTCASIAVDPSTYRTTQRPGGKKLQGIEWADKDDDDDEESAIVGVRSLGTEDTIAQVHPQKLCQRLWEETIKASPDCQLQQGKVVGASHEQQSQEKEKDGSTRFLGAQLEDGSTIPCDALLFACGPWTGNTMYGIKYHSTVIPTDTVLSQCVFFSGCGDPEVYVRPDATAYCTGFPDPAVRVTEEPGQEEVRPETISQILSAVRDASGGSGGTSGGGALGKDPILGQACYLPTTDDGNPIMGLLPASAVGDAGGPCYVAAGHSCWGILMGPATGEAMASLMVTGQSQHVDLTPFDPARYPNIRPV